MHRYRQLLTYAAQAKKDEERDHNSSPGMNTVLHPKSAKMAPETLRHLLVQ